MKLRDYQQKAIDAVLSYWSKHLSKNPALVLPTGAGKTIVFSFLIKALFKLFPNARVLVLAHRKELISQAEEKLLSVWPEAPTGVYSAGLNRREFAPVTIASRGTLINAIDKYRFVFDYVIIDECHNISPDEDSGYQKILNELKRRNSSLKVLGVTATPYRVGSGSIVGSDQILSEIAFELKIKELIDRGFLCRIKAPNIHQGDIDTSKVKVSGGDFKAKELDSAARKNQIVESAINEWERQRAIESFKLTVFFGVSVAHAEMISECLAKRGIDCPVIHANTHDVKRRQILESARKLEIEAIVNVGVLTEGTDIPPIDCIAMLRPTRSLGLYLQIVGRGLRLSPDTNKTHCTLLDFGGNLKRFGTIDTAQPAAKRGKDERTQVCGSCESIVGMYVRNCPECEHQFLPKPAKECPHCRTLVAPSCATCVSCDHVFISHEDKAAMGRVFSDDSPPEKIFVNSTTLHVKSDCGANYITVCFHTGGAKFAMRHVYIGYPGLAGEKAVDDWKALTNEGVKVPTNAFEAARLYDANREIFKPISSVLIDPVDPQSLAKLITLENGTHVL